MQSRPTSRGSGNLTDAGVLHHRQACLGASDGTAALTQGCSYSCCMSSWIGVRIFIPDKGTRRIPQDCMKNSLVERMNGRFVVGDTEIEWVELPGSLLCCLLLKRSSLPTSRTKRRGSQPS